MEDDNEEDDDVDDDEEEEEEEEEADDEVGAGVEVVVLAPVFSVEIVLPGSLLLEAKYICDEEICLLPIVWELKEQ